MNRRLIVLNTGVSYLRSLLAVALTLFSTRWVLQALGKADLGLYYAVGGVVVFLSFINTSMAFSSQRHFAFALGHGGADELKDWFNTSFALHVMFAIGFLVLSVPLGIVAFRCFLAIPDPRYVSCIWVFGCSVCAAFFSIVSVPFVALYNARQRIYELTIIQMTQTVSLFGLAWWLLRCTMDRLIAYAVGMMLIQCVVTLVQIVRCRFAFRECSFECQRMWNHARYRKLLSFSGWSMTSTFAYILRGQGIALLLNNFGTSGVNAAYGIANQVAGQVGFLSNGFLAAVAPEITMLEGSGNRQKMIQLATNASKYITLLVLLVLTPLFSDVEPLLLIWLKKVPEHTASFVRVMFLSFLSVQMVIGVTVAVKAVGKIAWPEIWAAIVLLFSLPLAAGAIRVGLSMIWVVSAVAVTAAGCAASTLLCARAIWGYPVSSWVKEVFCRNVFVAVACLALNFTIHRFWGESMLRLVCVAICDGCCLAILGWAIVLDKNERQFLLDKFYTLMRK